MQQGLAGRERELRVVDEALTRALDWRGGALCISGEPGIGKTALLDALASRAGDAGASTLRGRCWEGGGAPAYFPWMAIVRTALEIAGPALKTAQPALHELASALVAPTRREDVGDAFARYDAVWSLLRLASEQRPLVVILDDVHAADEATLGLLRYAVREAKMARVLVAVAYRPREAAARPVVSSAMADLGREGSSIEVVGLDLAASREIAAAVSGAFVPLTVAEEIHRKAGGNPFFVGQVAQLWAQVGDVHRIGVPEGVRSVIRRRLDDVSPEARSFLELVAVVGRDVDVPRLQTGAGLDVERSLAHLAEVQAAGILQRRPDGTYGFVHSLLRETVYEDIGDVTRRQMHRGTGEALLERFGRADDDRISEIAHHFVQAVPLVEATRAVDFLVEAGDAARRQHANTEAVVHYRQAIELIDQHRLDVDPLPLWLRVADAYAEHALRDQAIDAAVTATDLARERGDWPSFARAALAAGRNSDMFATGTRTVPLYEEALEHFAADDPVAIRVRARLASELTPRDPRRVPLSHESVTAARASGDPSLLVEALRRHGEVLAATATAGERIAIGEEMVAAAVAAGDRAGEATGRNTHALGLLCAGRRHEADLALHRAFAVAETLPLPYVSRFAVHMLSGMLALLDGRWDDAAHHQRLTLEWGWERLGRVNAIMGAFILEVTSLLDRGRFDETRERMAFVGALAPGLVHWDIARDYVAAIEGKEVEGAADRLRHYVEDGLRSIPFDGTRLLLLTYLVEVCFVADERQAAPVLAEQFAPFAGEVIFCGQGASGPVCGGAADRYLGMLASVRGSLDSAVESLEAALRMNLAIGARPEVVRTRYYLANALHRRQSPGDLGRAEEVRRAGATLAADLGMTAWEARLRALDTGAHSTATDGRRVATKTAVARLRNEGAVWTIEFEGRTCRIKDATGVRYLARLLAAPGRELAAVELAAAGVDQRDTGPALDGSAIDSYRRRIQELQMDVEEAEAGNDLVRAERAQDELDALVDELSGAVGLGGRSRASGSTAERARSAVTKAIRTTLRRLADADADLGRYLSVTIRTGTFCAFSPELAGRPLPWEVDQQAVSSRQ